MKHKLKKLYKESWSVQGTVPLFSLGTEENHVKPQPS